MDIAQKIKQLRTQLGLQQQETATFMGLTRQTYALVESGKKDLTLPELEKLAGFLHSSVAEFLFGPKIIDENTLNMGKYEEIVMFCLYYGGNDWKSMTKEKLSKLVCLADLEWYRKHGESMMGNNYFRYLMGPIPDHFFWLVDSMFIQGQILIEYKGVNVVLTALEEPSHNHLNAQERLWLKNMAEEWKDRPARELASQVDRQVSWKLAHRGAYVPYEFVKPKNSFI